jgi:hypothetical protein
MCCIRIRFRMKSRRCSKDDATVYPPGLSRGQPCSHSPFLRLLQLRKPLLHPEASRNGRKGSHGCIGARMHPFGAALRREQQCPAEIRSVEQADPPRRRRTDRRCDVRWHGFGAVYKCLGEYSGDRLSCYPPSRHADVNKPAIIVPNGVNACTESRD